jgi:predicted patatin/cPLA2 family phospholipase
VEACANRYRVYNQTLEDLEEAEARGEVFVIRPQKTVEVARLERDVNKLNLLYEEGYEETKSMFDDLKKFIGKL